METHDLETETYETIPWSQLAPARTPLPTRVAFALIGAIAAVALAYFLASLLRDDPPRVVVTLPPESAPADQGAIVAGPPVTTPTPVTVAAPEAAVLYSEADLMAVIPEEEQRAASARAIWFVTDYFTVDGDPATAASVRDALPAAINVAIPHDGFGGVSYVEWAEALAVRPDGPSRYAVDVIFRTLAAGGEGPPARDPVRAVRVRVVVDASGTAAILDLPEPLALETATAEVEVPAGSDPPPDVVDRAVTLASSLGPVDDVLTSGFDAAGWRIVVLVGDPSGLSWPIAVRP